MTNGETGGGASDGTGVGSGTGGRQVCVIGGGLAGIAAALRLVDAGMRVTLIESRRELGGATYSFARGDLTVDTGQHVFLRCYTEYRALLDRLGSTHHTVLQSRFAVPVLRPGQPPSWLVRGRGLPAPAHMLPALARYGLLTPAERRHAITTAAALRRVDPDDPATDDTSFGAWLSEHGQGERAIARLWGLVSVAALNATPEDSSLALAARVFRTGLLESAGAGDIGRPIAPLSEVHGQPAGRLLSRLGAQVLTSAKAEAVEMVPGGYRVRLASGTVETDAVLVAVPHRAASRLVPELACPDREDWRHLGAAPIVNVHVVYARPVTDLAFAAAVDSPVQWFFDRSECYPGEGQHLVVSLSAAEDVIGLPAAALVQTQLDALGALFPAARDAPVRDAFVSREPRATFRQAPGTRRYRPPAATKLPRLALAGAWTATGWPDTMEGAVRSGHRAADLIISQLAARPARREVLA